MLFTSLFFCGIISQTCYKIHMTLSPLILSMFFILLLFIYKLFFLFKIFTRTLFLKYFRLNLIYIFVYRHIKRYFVILFKKKTLHLEYRGIFSALNIEMYIEILKFSVSILRYIFLKKKKILVEFIWTKILIKLFIIVGKSAFRKLFKTIFS